jgi:hypothetical protein
MFPREVLAVSQGTDYANKGYEYDMHPRGKDVPIAKSVKNSCLTAANVS